MIKTLQNMTAALVCCCLLFMSSAVMAQCPCTLDGAAQYGSATAAPYSNTTVTVTGCIWAGEYSNITVMAGETYDVNVSINDTTLTYMPAVTVFDTDSMSLDCGMPISTFTATYDGIYHALVTKTDSTGFCVSENTCHTLTVTCLSCLPAPSEGCTDATAHNYNAFVTVDDGSCETCTDGIMNGDEEGVDCGGSNIYCAVCPTLIESCDTTSVDSGGIDGNYSSSEFITTTYCPDAGSMGNIQATFTAFDLENGYDFLSIYDGAMVDDSLLIGVFTGNTLPSAIIASIDGCLTFVFTSDGSVTATGWEADIACVNCDAPTLTANAYCNAGDGSGYYVDVTFTPGSGSSYTLTDGTVTAPLNAAATLTVGPYDNASTVVFTVTDDNDACSATATTNFNCAIGCTDPAAHNYDGLAAIDDETCETCTDGIMNGDETGVDCGGTNPNCVACPVFIQSCDTTSVDSGGVEGNYSSDEYTVATYCPEAGTMGNIQATFTAFNLETNYDFLYVYDGDMVDDSLLIGTFTGSTLPEAIEASNGCLTFVFDSDGSVTASGWEIDFTCVMPCDEIMVMAEATDVTCAGNDGTAMVTDATGGSGVYVSIVWSDGSEGINASGLAMGDYMVTVTDDMGCTGEAMVTVGDGCVSTCGPTSNLTTSVQDTPFEVTLSWDAVAGAEAYQMAGRKVGGQIKTFPETQNTSRTFTAGISYDTDYQWSVRVKCDGVWTDYVLPPAQFNVPAPAGKNNANSYDIFEDGNNLSIKMYPNPANTQVVLELNEAVNFDQIATQKTVKITDMLGRVINTYSTTNAQMVLDANEFANGSYFVAVSNGQATVVEKLLIVK